MIEELDGLIHQPARLKLMSRLYAVEEADMIYLKKQTGLTWGNISSHATKLEEAEYLEIKKSIVSKKTKTVLKLTAKGRKAYEKYREQILSLLS